MVGMFGAAAGGLFMGMENKKAEKLQQAERDAKDDACVEAAASCLVMKDSKIPLVEASKAEAIGTGAPPKDCCLNPISLDPSLSKPGDSDSSSGSLVLTVMAPWFHFWSMPFVKMAVEVSTALGIASRND